MIIFSIDLYHEITPITKGARYVFKKPMYDYVYNPEPEPKKNETEKDEYFWHTFQMLENPDYYKGGLAD